MLQFPDKDDDDDLRHAGEPVSLQVAVKSALTSAYDINAAEISVSTISSYVILEGRVRYRGDIDRAIEIAEDIAGEGRVRTRLITR